jgi:hypothetical protein
MPPLTRVRQDQLTVLEDVSSWMTARYGSNSSNSSPMVSPDHVNAIFTLQRPSSLVIYLVYLDDLAPTTRILAVEQLKRSLIEAGIIPDYPEGGDITIEALLPYHQLHILTQMTGPGITHTMIKVEISQHHIMEVEDINESIQAHMNMIPFHSYPYLAGCLPSFRYKSRLIVTTFLEDQYVLTMDRSAFIETVRSRYIPYAPLPNTPVLFAQIDDDLPDSLPGLTENNEEQSNEDQSVMSGILEPLPSSPTLPEIMTSFFLQNRERPSLTLRSISAPNSPVEGGHWFSIGSPRPRRHSAGCVQDCDEFEFVFAEE